jgi:hypothetical protein
MAVTLPANLYMRDTNKSDTPDSLPDLLSQSDQNRIEFLRNDLSAAFTFVSVAETERSIGNNEHAQRSFADAEKAYRTMQRFLSDPKHASHFSDEERQELTAGLEKLRERLDRF